MPLQIFYWRPCGYGICVEATGTPNFKRQELAVESEVIGLLRQADKRVLGSLFDVRLQLGVGERLEQLLLLCVAQAGIIFAWPLSVDSI